MAKSTVGAFDWLADLRVGVIVFRQVTPLRSPFLTGCESFAPVQDTAHPAGPVETVLPAQRHGLLKLEIFPAHPNGPQHDGEAADDDEDGHEKERDGHEGKVDLPVHLRGERDPALKVALDAVLLVQEEHRRGEDKTEEPRRPDQHPTASHYNQSINQSIKGKEARKN